MLIGYARISPFEQESDLQLDALRAAGCAHIHTDTFSLQRTSQAGARDESPALAGALAALCSGDTLVVWKLDRVGRSTPHLLRTIRELEARGIEFASLQEGLDTTAPGGQFVFQVFAAMAGFERDLARERTKIGLAAARSRGRCGGRRHKLDAAATQNVLSMAKQKVPVPQICEAMKISRATYFRYLKAASDSASALIGALVANANFWAASADFWAASADFWAASADFWC